MNAANAVNASPWSDRPPTQTARRTLAGAALLAAALLVQTMAAQAATAQAAAQAPEMLVVFDGSTEAVGWGTYSKTGGGAFFFDALVASPVDGSVWAATQMALLRFRGTERDEYRTGDLQAELGEYCGGFKPLAFDAQGTLWMKASCSGPDERANLVTFDGTSWRLLRRADQGAPEYGLRPFLMAFGPGNVMWLATYFGLVRRDGSEWTLFNPENSPLPHQQVSALHVEPGGAVWVGTANGHLARFDGTEWKVFRYTGPGSASGLDSAEMPWSLATDPKGKLYFTYHYNGRVRRQVGERFETAPCPPLYPANGHSENVAFDKDGVLWVAHDFDSNRGVVGLYRWDGTRCRAIDLPDNNARLLAIDREGNKWVATQNGRIIVYREGGVRLGP